MGPLSVWIRRWSRPVRFCLSGGTGTLVNLGSLVIFVELMQMNSFLLKNLANAISMGIGAIAVFFLHRAWTWDDAQQQTGKGLVRQFVVFAGSLSVGVGCRLVLFAVLEKYTAIPYLLNVALGIAAAAIVDYFLFDRLVFLRKK